ncbi:MAG: DUF502 domain-containing protein [Candidatus Zixiibacteriota bacterium]|nr:MAG: DUF502 domain-containing protein [candidate division Zixibacteria bacterium]
MNFKNELKKTLKTRFISGLLVIVPLFIAFAILKFAVLSIDNFVKPYLMRVIGQEYDFPFIGLAVTLMLIILTGILTTNVFGQKLVKKWENILLKIPFFSVIYSAAKKLLEGFASTDNRTFEKVVMVEFPRKGLYALGFLANRLKIYSSGGEKTFWSVFIASTPTPFSGIVILVPEGEATILDMAVDEGIKYFVSGSVAARSSWRTAEKYSIKKKSSTAEICS